VCNHNDYYKCLNKISNNPVEHKKTNPVNIPILNFDVDNKSIYKKYTIFLRQFIENIQNKIYNSLTKLKKLPDLCPLEIIILIYIIKILDEGKFSDVTIMDIYSIMYCYDECSNSLDNLHNIFNCLCKKIFQQNNNLNFDTYSDIRNSIKKHYDNTRFVSALYDNYVKGLNNLCDTDKIFKYNIFHPVFYRNYQSSNTNFTILNDFNIIANSANYVIDIIIKPQFNKLNFYDVIFRGISNNFLLSNCSKKQIIIKDSVMEKK